MPDASSGTCSDVINQNYFTGREFSETQYYYGVRASIDPDTGFKHCNVSPPLDLTGGSLLWVAVEGPDNTNEIIQVGIIHCTATTGMCNAFPDQYRYFWAYGGCNGAAPTPRDLGPANLNSHSYEVSDSDANGLWDFKVDGVVKAQLANASSGVFCWLVDPYSSLRAAWWGEQWDASDGLGSSVVPDTLFAAMQIRYASTWHNINIGSCVGHGPIHGHSTFCSLDSGNSMSVWSVY